MDKYIACSLRTLAQVQQFNCSTAQSKQFGAGCSTTFVEVVRWQSRTILGLARLFCDELRHCVQIVFFRPSVFSYMKSSESVSPVS